MHCILSGAHPCPVQRVPRRPAGEQKLDGLHAPCACRAHQHGRPVALVLETWICSRHERAMMTARVRVCAPACPLERAAPATAPSCRSSGSPESLACPFIYELSHSLHIPRPCGRHQLRISFCIGAPRMLAHSLRIPPWKVAPPPRANRCNVTKHTASAGVPSEMGWRNCQPSRVSRFKAADSMQMRDLNVDWAPGA